MKEADIAHKVSRGSVRATKSAPGLATVPQEARSASTRPRPRFDWADTLAGQIHVLALPEPFREFRVVASRKWRFDLAWPTLRIACEIDGSEWTHGRHGRGNGMQSDCEKLNAALLAGWRPFRFVGSQVKSGYALAVLEQVLRQTR